jgi:hypothetical protein
MRSERERKDQGWVIAVHPFGVLRMRVHLERPLGGDDRSPRSPTPRPEGTHTAVRHETDPISTHPTTVPAA